MLRAALDREDECIVRRNEEQKFRRQCEARTTNAAKNLEISGEKRKHETSGIEDYCAHILISKGGRLCLRRDLQYDAALPLAEIDGDIR